jgi:hypothetical protein
LPIEGLPEPLRVNIDFAALVIDEIIEWLTILCAGATGIRN